LKQSILITTSFFIFLILPARAFGQAFDTTLELRKLITEFVSLKNIGYSYVKNIEFPNGEKDRVIGKMHLSNDDKILFDSSDAFTMLYTSHWFYKADHRNKELSIVNLDNEKNKKLKKAVENDLFKNGAFETFMNNVVMKTAIVKKYKQEGDIVNISLKFPPSQNVKSIEIIYDRKNKLPVSYKMVVLQPWQRSPKGIQSIEAKVECSDFSKTIDKGALDLQSYFTCKKGKIELKKYDQYKLSEKI